MEMAEQLRQLEQDLLSSSVRKNIGRVSTLLTDDFCEFGRSGKVYTKAEILALLQAEEAIDVAMKEYVCRPVAENAALVTYRSERAHGDQPALVALRSSLWVFRDARWQILFHQGTPVAAR